MQAAKVQRQRGQAIIVMAMAISVIVAVVGLAVDGGYALVQRRSAQNGADFAAMAAARIVSIWIADNTQDGTDANVRASINAAISTNGGTPLTYGATGSPVYVSSDGAVLGYVGTGTIPSFSIGVRVTVNRTWAPYLLRIIGANSWSASATATARGGFYDGAPPGSMFPVGVAEAFFNNRQPCSDPVSNDSDDPCYPARMTPGTLNVPGGFGWLKFGCSGYGLGQGSAGGCETNEGFLQTEIGPPGSAFGCCDKVGVSGSADRIGSLPGNKTAADCSVVIASGATVPIAVWDYAGGEGANAWYHIVGFTGFQITDCEGGKAIQGVWRQPFYLGPTTTSPGFAGAALAVQLVK